jgi:ketosteroid isomerase-like protein
MKNAREKALHPAEAPPDQVEGEDAMQGNAELSADNVALASYMMSNFGHKMEVWYENLHEEVSVELPQGESIGLPGLVSGQAALDMFRLAAEVLDVKFHDIRIHPMADPNKIVVEYRGRGYPQGRLYEQDYVSFQEFRDGKLFRFREYFDTAVAKSVIGDLVPSPA